MTTEESIKLPESKLTKKQVKTFRKDFTEGGRPGVIVAEVRHDDECGNGHNTFAITATLYGPDRYPGESTVTHKSGKTLWCHSGGCCHEEVEKHFPELAPFIKWHLVSTDGPMHGVANTLYHAGDRDCWGTRKGEVRQWEKAIKFGNFPIEYKGRAWGGQKFIKWVEEMGEKICDCEVISLSHEDRKTFSDKYTLGGYGEKWHDCPFDSEREALQFLEACKLGIEIVKTPSAWGEGKERDFAAARSSAVWPDATDEQLSAEPEELKRMLLERLPALMEQFKKDVESLGFVY